LITLLKSFQKASKFPEANLKVNFETKTLLLQLQQPQKKNRFVK